MARAVIACEAHASTLIGRHFARMTRKPGKGRPVVLTGRLTMQEVGQVADDSERIGYVVQLPDGTYLSGGNPPLWSDEAFTVFPEFIDADAEAGRPRDQLPEAGRVPLPGARGRGLGRDRRKQPVGVANPDVMSVAVRGDGSWESVHFPPPGSLGRVAQGD